MASAALLHAYVMVHLVLSLPLNSRLINEQVCHQLSSKS
jgi:hypothetical protein